MDAAAVVAQAGGFPAGVEQRGDGLRRRRVLRPVVLETDDKAPLNANKLLDRALDFWGRPQLSPPTRRALKSFAAHAIGDADRSWKKQQYPPLIENALRHLIAISPDMQTS